MTLGPFMDSASLAADQVTMGQIDKAGAPIGVVEVTTTCLEKCDNRADPRVALHWEGAHVDNFMRIEALSLATTESAVKAWSSWAGNLEKANKGRPRSAGFTCPSFSSLSDVTQGVTAFNDIRAFFDEVAHRKTL